MISIDDKSNERLERPKSTEIIVIKEEPESNTNESAIDLESKKTKENTIIVPSKPERTRWTFFRSQARSEMNS